MNHISLSELLSKGWAVHLRGIMELESAPLSGEKIAEIKMATNDRATHIIFMHQVGRQGLLIYPLQDEAELELARWKQASECPQFRAGRRPQYPRPVREESGLLQSFDPWASRSPDARKEIELGLAFAQEGDREGHVPDMCAPEEDGRRN